jgi:hypothetical protein
MGHVLHHTMEAILSTHEQKLEYLAIGVKKLIFHYMTKIKSFRLFKLYFNLAGMVINLNFFSAFSLINVLSYRV